MKENYIVEKASIFKDLVMELLPILANEDAKAHLRMGGLFKRYYMMETSRVYFDKVISDDETKLHIVEDMAIHVNSFYVNLRGGLDNIGFILNYEFNLELENNKIDIFKGKDFKKVVKKFLTDYDSIINQYSNWYAEFLKYRDTAAHRFPIYIPPNVLTNYEEEAEYKRLEKLENDFMSRGDFTTATNYRIRKKMIGSFKPYGFINKHNEFF